jgi:hypothetical protein
MRMTARSPLDLSGTKGRYFGSNGFEFAPELAHFPIFLREISGRGPQFTLDDNFPMRAILLHASS